MIVRKVLLVGAGNIARTHAAVLKETPGVMIDGVFDLSGDLARGFADTFDVPHVHTSLDDAAASAADAIHILTPPDYHLAGALPFVARGKSVLIEKPACVSHDECARLALVADAAGAIIGINQNFVFNPAYLQLKAAVESGRLGRPRHLSYIYEMPLRQLLARQFGHWMFREPLNILLEQAVHPLSQLVDLAGRVEELVTLSERPMEIAPGVAFHTACQVAMRCARMPAQLRFHVGSQFTVCRISVVCDDGVAVADVFSNQFHTLERTRYMEPVDGWLSARATAAQVRSAGWANLRDYAAAMVRLKSRSDPFYLGMRGSIQAFYRELAERGKPRIDLAFGAHLVELCERIAQGFRPMEQSAPSRTPTAAAPAADAPLVAVLGGTGFIGTHTVSALLNAGLRVRAMARGTANLSAVFRRSGVEVVRGDVRDASHVARAVAGAQYVVNLAHGGGGASFEAIRAAMVDSAVLVAEQAHAAGVQRLVHVGSIASLYLGNFAEIITGQTPPDPDPATRSDYAHAKALADAAVMAVHRRTGLPVVLLRPGVVMGEGTSPFHGGLGFFNNDQYCIGWNPGTNPLPWVLVEDCADAIVSSLTAPEAVGKAYNLVGDVRPTAREFIDELARATGRPLRFVPSRTTGLWLLEMGKWIIKRASGRRVPRPYRRDLLSRGLLATFDCSDAKRDLGWQPVDDPQVFNRRAVAVHAIDK